MNAPKDFRDLPYVDTGATMVVDWNDPDSVAKCLANLALALQVGHWSNAAAALVNLCGSVGRPLTAADRVALQRAIADELALRCLDDSGPPADSPT